jgi:AhpD family alkylhydroperoxidase
MAAVKLYNGDGDKKAQEVQANLKQAFGGKLPEVFQAMGRNGEFLEALLKLDAAAGKGLDAKTKELICIAVSAVNGCGYCLDAHRALALKAGISEEEVTAAIEVAAAMSAFNKFNAALGMNHDIKA